MALNQVIHGSNRVVENPNRYKLNPVAGQANTYDFEKQPGVITDNGTPYNKLILDKIDNVLSYLTPSVEKVIGGTQNTTQNIIDIESITPTWTSSGTSLGNEIKLTYKQIVDLDLTYQPELKITSNTSNGFISGNTSPTTNVNAYINTQYGSTTYNSNNFTDVFKNTSYNSSYANNFNLARGNGTNQYAYFDYDFKISKNKTFNCYISSTQSNMYVKLYESDNGIDWVQVQSISLNTDVVINNLNKQYYRIEARNSYSGANALSIYYMYFKTDVKKPLYQNQFTLDNNTSFTNKQRVLVETDKNFEEIEKTITQNILPTDITPTWSNVGENIGNEININLNSFITYTPSLKIYTDENQGFYPKQDTTLVSDYLTIGSLHNFTAYNDSDIFKIELLRTTYNSDYFNRFGFRGTTPAYLFFDYDMQIECKPTFNIYFTNGSEFDGIIECSNDKVNWYKECDLISSTDGIYSINNYYRYYRVKFNKTFSSSAILKIFYLYISSITYKDQQEIPYNVESNTLNGIDIPTLLQPSTKYELIYDETNNKFNLGGNLTLFDITLSEAVNQVDLTGINKKLKIGKIYSLIVIGTASTSTTFYLGGNVGGYLSSDIAQSNMSLFTPYDISGELKLIYTNASSVSISTPSVVDGYEYIKFTNASDKFNVGTRIIIKEVA